MTDIFKYIKAAQFFPAYAPQVRDWKKKLSGKNGRGNPTGFTDDDRTAIRDGLQDLIKSLAGPAA